MSGGGLTPVTVYTQTVGELKSGSSHTDGRGTQEYKFTTSGHLVGVHVLLYL